MPTNLYGPNDNYDLNNSHVLPALIRKFHTAKVNKSQEVEIWGTGKPLREFLHVDDLAEACLFLMLNYNDKQFVNVGSGKEISIKELALLVKKIVGYEGALTFNTSKPDGTPRKLMDVSKLAKAGWSYKIELEDGIKSVYKEALKSGVLD
jgi:GDP-L-fucose synthase